MSALAILLIAIFVSAVLILASVILTGLLMDRRAGERWLALNDEFLDLSAEIIRWNLTVEMGVFLKNHEEIDTPEEANRFLRFAYSIKEYDLEKAYNQYLLTKTDFGVGAET